MIEIRGLSVRFGTTLVLDAISSSIPDRASVAITGPSGSGKTTLLRLIAGLIRPDGGEIWISGRLVSSPSCLCPPSRRSIGFVFQAPALWPHMTVAQNIRFGLDRLPRDARDTRIDELLARAEIRQLAGRYPHELSGGEAQRVALLRAIAPRPRYLLMDEPLANIDPDLKARLIALIRECTKAEGMTLVYVTHHPDEARAVADRIVRLSGGRLAEERPIQSPEDRAQR